MSALTNAQLVLKTSLAYNVIIWSDSIGANLNSSFDLSTGFSFSDKRSVVNQGLGSQTGVMIGARQGGLPWTCMVSGGQIPASGAVDLSSVYPDALYFNGVLNVGQTRSLAVSIAGIPGTLLRTTTDSGPPNVGAYTFTRTNAGSVVSAAGTQRITPTNQGTYAPYTKYDQILFGFTNGVAGSNGETDVSVMQAMVAALGPTTRYMILPLLNGGYSGDQAGGGNYISKMARNASMAAAFPNDYYDYRADFIVQSKSYMQANYPAAYATDWTQGFIGTRSDVGTDSDWDIANDVPPRAMRGDYIHPGPYGKPLQVALLNARMNAKGWTSPGVASLP